MPRGHRGSDAEEAPVRQNESVGPTIARSLLPRASVVPRRAYAALPGRWACRLHRGVLRRLEFPCRVSMAPHAARSLSDVTSPSQPNITRQDGRMRHGVATADDRCGGTEPAAPGAQPRVAVVCDGSESWLRLDITRPNRIAHWRMRGTFSALTDGPWRDVRDRLMFLPGVGGIGASM